MKRICRTLVVMLIVMGCSMEVSAVRGMFKMQTQQGEKLVGELNCVKVATEGGPTTGTIVSICCGADGEAVLFTIEIQQGEQKRPSRHNFSWCGHANT